MSGEEEIDYELDMLKKRRNLLSKTIALKETRIRAKIDNPQTASSWKDLINNNTSPERESDEDDGLKYLKQLMNIESHDFEKNDDKYSATITMNYITLAVEFSAENTSKGDKKTCKITNLSARVSDIDDCYLNELQSCIDYCEENNDLQLLICSIPGYQQKHDDRVNMTQKLTNLEGWFLKHSKRDRTKFYVCSDKNQPRTVYCKVTWSLQFSTRSLCFNHWFNFEDVDEEGFVRSNKRLLKTFNNFDDNVLPKTWMELYKVITNTNESE